MNSLESAELANSAIRLLLPGGGVMFNLVAPYIDESGTHDQAATICAGGYIFESGAAQELNREMGSLFAEYRIPYFHASEIIPGKPKEGGNGLFDHLSLKDRDAIARAFIASIKEHSAYGFAATVRKADYERIATAYPALPRAYGFMLMQCMILVANWCDRSGFSGKAFYFFEDGATHKRNAIRWLDDFVLASDRLKQRYRYFDRAFVDKHHSPAINAADLLVYRWSSHLENKDKPGYEPRKDLLALMRPQDTVADWAGEHLTGLEGVVADWADRHGIS